MAKWWEKKIGRAGEDVCPKCEEEEQTPDHVVFKVRRVRDEKGRREWARESGSDGGVLRGRPPSDLKIRVTKLK